MTMLSLIPWPPIPSWPIAPNSLWQLPLTVFMADQPMLPLNVGATLSLSALTQEPNQHPDRGCLSAGFGAAADFVKDLDGDGYSDVVVGAPNLEGSGEVYFFSGKSGGAIRTLAGPLNEHGFGCAVVGAAIHGAEASVVYVASPSLTGGAIYCFAGDDLSSTWVIDAGYNEVLFGRHLFNVGDCDGDGNSELLATFMSRDPSEKWSMGFALLSTSAGVRLREYRMPGRCDPLFVRFVLAGHSKQVAGRGSRFIIAYSPGIDSTWYIQSYDHIVESTTCPIASVFGRYAEVQSVHSMPDINGDSVDDFIVSYRPIRRNASMWEESSIGIISATSLVSGASGGLIRVLNMHAASDLEEERYYGKSFDLLAAPGSDIRFVVLDTGPWEWTIASHNVSAGVIDRSYCERLTDACKVWPYIPEEVRCGPDLDGDDYPDVLVRCYSQTGPLEMRGVFVFSGATFDEITSINAGSLGLR